MSNFQRVQNVVTGLCMILCAVLPAVREVLRSTQTILAEFGP